jgi:PHP family Zn ribbon phosphoesterase
MAELKYHTKRYRDTCIGAGHFHCPHCDNAISPIFREDCKKLNMICAKCGGRIKTGGKEK